MNPFHIIKSQVYFLQLENYHLRRFLSLMISLAHLSLSKSATKNIVWTIKMRIVFYIALFLHIFSAIIVGYLFNGFYQVLITALFLYAFVYIYYFFLVVAVIFILPLDYIARSIIFNRAKKILNGHKNLIIIGVTGSYGKTTMKEAISTLLSERYNVLKTPDNINTPIGVARLIKDKLSKETEVFIVEMGAYKMGDIKKLCAIAQPDISVLTGINESHIERFGNLKNTISAKFEIVQNTKKDGTVILNADDSLIFSNYKNYIGDKKVVLYGKGKNYTKYKLDNVNFSLKTPGITYDLVHDGKLLGSVESKYLAHYIIPTIYGALSVCENFELTDDEIFSGLKALAPAPHRLQVASNKNDILIIDDSYNGNPEGALAAINVLKEFSDKRKIYITPGFVEMGNENERVHRNIGSQLASVADKVFLIKNSATIYIADELERNGFSLNDIMWFKSHKEMQKMLPNITKAGDVILFQNDWPENYN